MRHFALFLVAFTYLITVHAETTRDIPQYDVNSEAIARGPLNNMSQQNLCNGDQTFLVYADRDTISQGGRALQTCEMYLNPYFAQLIKAFIPKCAKEAALKTGMNVPTSVSIEQMGGFASRNARNSTKLSRHAHGMALDISAISLHYAGQSTQRIGLTSSTSNQEFYDAFRSCWDKSAIVATDEQERGSRCTCSIGHTHTHDPSNALHDDHMHLSLSCPSSSGTVNCENEKEIKSFAIVR